MAEPEVHNRVAAEDILVQQLAEAHIPEEPPEHSPVVEPDNPALVQEPPAAEQPAN